MADNSPISRQHYEFVDSPPDDTICPVCLDVVEDPHLMECCGHHYCRKCVERLRTCPLCRAQGIRAMRDRFFERSHLNVLQVRCCERAHGCSWTGQLSELKRHLPECQWTEVGCPHQCGDLVQRRLLQEHTRNCPKRPYACEFCQFEATFVEITKEHWPVCEKYPVACPNACSACMVERMALPNHLEKCLARKVQCEFSHFGCRWEGVRKDMEGHLEERWRSHTTLLSNHNLLELESQQKVIDSLQQKLKQQEEQLTTVTQLTTSLFEKFNELSLAKEKEDSTDEEDSSAASDSSAVGACAQPRNLFRFTINRVKFKMSQNQQHLSPVFYLGNPGYRMQLSVYPGGRYEGKGTHVSVYAHILRGDHDDELSWPFRGHVTVRLCSEFPFVKNHEMDMVYDDSVSSTCSDRRPWYFSGISAGNGLDHFLPHLRLSMYLHDDQLTFELPQAST